MANPTDLICPSCQTRLGRQKDYRWCGRCGRPLPSKIQSLLRDRETATDSHKAGMKNSRSSINNSSIVFSCVTCNSSLSIRLPVRDGIYRCTNCKAAYRTIKASAPSVFFVMPAQDEGFGKSEEKQKPRKEVPPEVKSALSVFGLDGQPSFDQIRQTYRELVKGYHPDRVAHLGSDLRKLAEAKTKELNAAFKTLEKFFNA